MIDIEKVKAEIRAANKVRDVPGHTRTLFVMGIETGLRYSLAIIERHERAEHPTCQEMVDCPECKGVSRYLTGFGALPSISNWLCAECNGTGKVKSGKPMPCPEHPYKGGS